MSRRLRSINDVVDAHLCTGCGACAGLFPELWSMQDVASAGRRPLPITPLRSGMALGSKGEQALSVCPGQALEHPDGWEADQPFGGEWGPVLGLYECWASDPVVRKRGSSGGVITALATHALTSGAVSGVLQVRATTDTPPSNGIVLSRTPDDILASAGSRYAPASPCERLDLVESCDGSVLVVGKPCDIYATQRAAGLRPELARRIALTVSIFCAGTPSTVGTHQVIRDLGADPADVVALDYRGDGWPGRFRLRTSAGDVLSMSYADSWGKLTRHRQWRCMICPDHTGEFADLSVGDPWYRAPEEGEPGRSLVVIRTEAGRSAFLAALAAGAVQGEPVPLDRLPQSQPSLAAARGAVWGRVLTLRAAGVGAPSYVRLPSFPAWLRLPIRAKAGSVVGTVRRIHRRHLRTPERALWGDPP